MRHFYSCILSYLKHFNIFKCILFGQILSFKADCSLALRVPLQLWLNYYDNCYVMFPWCCPPPGLMAVSEISSMSEGRDHFNAVNRIHCSIFSFSSSSSPVFMQSVLWCFSEAALSSVWQDPLLPHILLHLFLSVMCHSEKNGCPYSTVLNMNVYTLLQRLNEHLWMCRVDRFY